MDRYTLEIIIDGKKYTFVTSSSYPWIAVDYDGKVSAFQTEPVGRIDWGKWWVSGERSVDLTTLGTYRNDWEEMCWHAPTWSGKSQRAAFDHAMKILG